jgi:hypothetical protein
MSNNVGNQNGTFASTALKTFYNWMTGTTDEFKNSGIEMVDKVFEKRSVANTLGSLTVKGISFFKAHPVIGHLAIDTIVALGGYYFAPGEKFVNSALSIVGFGTTNMRPSVLSPEKLTKTIISATCVAISEGSQFITSNLQNIDCLKTPETHLNEACQMFEEKIQLEEMKRILSIRLNELPELERAQNPQKLGLHALLDIERNKSNVPIKSDQQICKDFLTNKNLLKNWLTISMNLEQRANMNSLNDNYLKRLCAAFKNLPVNTQGDFETALNNTLLAITPDVPERTPPSFPKLQFAQINKALNQFLLREKTQLLDKVKSFARTNEHASEEIKTKLKSATETVQNMKFSQEANIFYPCAQIQQFQQSLFSMKIALTDSMERLYPLNDFKKEILSVKEALSNSDRKKINGFTDKDLESQKEFLCRVNNFNEIKIQELKNSIEKKLDEDIKSIPNGYIHQYREITLAKEKKLLQDEKTKIEKDNEEVEKNLSTIFKQKDKESDKINEYRSKLKKAELVETRVMITECEKWLNQPENHQEKPKKISYSNKKACEEELRVRLALLEKKYKKRTKDLRNQFQESQTRIVELDKKIEKLSRLDTLLKPHDDVLYVKGNNILKTISNRVSNFFPKKHRQ